MSFEYIVDNEIKKNLSDIDKNAVVNSITNDFVTLDTACSSNRSKAKMLMNEIFFKNEALKKETDKTKQWKTKIKICKTYMFYQTLKAFIWKNVYSNVNSMFDVSGENQEADNSSNKQKAMLVDVFDKMEFQKNFDEIVDNLLFYGEVTAFVAWKKKYEEYRRPIEFFKNLFSENPTKISKILEAITQGKNYWTDSRKIFDNPFVYPISPADLVFDPTQADNWDECPKIYRSYKTPNDIINNKYYQIDNDTKDEIKSLCKSSIDQVTASDQEKKNAQENEITNGNTIEVLEHWGDFKLPDGTLLKNWHAVVVARKYLVKFSKNDYTINPFICSAFIQDPDTKRGISPIYCVLSLAKTQENLVNRTCDMQSLSENPPIFAPEGFFSQEEIALYPGKIIEYGDNLSPANIQQMEFNNNIFLNDIEFLSDLMAETSGIFPNMAGAEEKGDKTATEISTKTQGQLTRLSMLIDFINQNLVVPSVKKVAKLCADFKTGVETLFINKDNKKEVIEVDDNVRQQEYKYTYSDRNISNERSNKADLVVQAIQQFAQHIPLNVQEIFTWYFEQKGVENPERFLQNQNTLPQPVQDALMQIPQVAQLAQGLLQQFQQQQSAAGENTPKNVNDVEVGV